MQKCKYNDAPFVPSNDCSSWESCTAEAYEQGKAEAKAEHDSEVEQKIYELQLKYEKQYGCAITEMYVEVVADLLEWIKGQTDG